MMNLNTEQFTQLKMFMTGDEIKAQAIPIDAGRTRDPDARVRSEQRMWDTKHREAHEGAEHNSRVGITNYDSPIPTLYESVQAGGIQSPVDLHHFDDTGRTTLPGESRSMVLGQGHHRVQAAHELGQLIPVNHRGAPFMWTTRAWKQSSWHRGQ